MIPRHVLFAPLAALIVGVVACAPRRENKVKAPQDEALPPAASAYVLIDRSSREITAIHLPSLRETVIRPARPADPNVDPTIHALSGPDGDGRIAYIEDGFFVPTEDDRRHSLKIIKLDGSGEAELFSRHGSAMWATSAAGGGEIGAHLALSPMRGRVAFLSSLVSVQMPGALLFGGAVEVWDVQSETGRKTDIQAVDDHLAWFPDGKRLAYVKLVEPESVNGVGRDGDPFGKTFQGWTRVPAVAIRDVDSGTESLLHMGWRPVVSVDGRSVLISDLEGHSKLVDVSTGRSSAVTWPGNAGAIAMPAEGVVLSWGRPAEGTEIRYTERNSPLVGPKPMLSLRLATLNSDSFQTVVPYIDPRRLVSFGVVSPVDED